MMLKPKKWSERSWADCNSGWQFRTFPSKRMFQVYLSIGDMQGDGFFHLVLHLFNKALALDVAFNGENHPKPRIEWKLIK